MKIPRGEAKERLAKVQLLTLSEEKALQLLEDYWLYKSESDIYEDIADGDFPSIPSDLIHTIATTDRPNTPIHESVEPLLIDALVFRLEKAKNSFIESELAKTGFKCKIEGKVEPAGLCPCCLYFSIDPGEEGLWDICPVCFWENGGDGPNQISLEEAQQDFAKFGAINERTRQFVDPDGRYKYLKQGEIDA